MSLSRQQRRALEHAQRKAARRAPSAPQASPAPASTGPRTLEGKAVSSQNALAHGLTAARLVLPWESQAEFDSLLEQLTAEHQPKTITETIYLREMAEQWWRLQRDRNQEHAVLCRAAEAELNQDLDQYGTLQKQVVLASRYATRHERAFHRSFSMLRTLQKERQACELEEAADAEAQADAEIPGRAAVRFAKHSNHRRSRTVRFAKSRTRPRSDSLTTYPNAGMRHY